MMRPARSVADVLQEAEVKRQRRELMRRWGPWVRTHRRVVEDTTWRLVARMSGAPLPMVESFLQRLELFAAGNKPRGSLDGFNIAALAAYWSLPSDEPLARIYAAMEHPDVGWIEQDFVVTFCDRNPETSDPGAAERMDRMRKRKKEREAACTFPQVESVTRNVTVVTTRSDHRREKEATEKEEVRAARTASDSSPQSPIHSNSGNSGEDSGDLEVWLAFDGKRIVAERCRMMPSRAWLEITRWRKELVDDLGALADMIHDADLMGLRSGDFTNRIRDRIIAYRYNAKGPALPLPPSVVRKRDGAA